MILQWLEVDSRFIIPGHPVLGTTQPRLPAPRQVSELKRPSGLCRTHEVLSSACATSLGTPEGFYKSNKAAILHYFMEDTSPEDLPYPKDALIIQDRTTLLHILTNFPRPVVRYACKFLIRWWLRSTSCSRLTVTIHSLSKPRRGWGAGVQRRLFWLDQRQGNNSTLWCSMQMTTTRSSCATSCCEHGVLNRQLQDWTEPRWLYWS